MGYIPNRIIPKRGSFKELNVDLYKDKTLETIFEIISHSKNIVKKLLKYIFEEVIWYINSIIYLLF